MKSSLKTLTRIQKFNIDEQRKLLVEQLNLEDKLMQNLADLNAEFVREKEFSATHFGVGDFGLYVKRYIERRQEIEEKLQNVRNRIVEIRDIIADMFKEQKTYEIVDEHREKIAQKEIDNKEQKMLDEIGTNTYIKREKKKSLSPKEN